MTKEEKKENRKVYYQANKETIIAKAMVYHYTNTMSIRARRKRWYQTNREKSKAQKNVYYQTNRENILQNNRVYRQNNKEEVRSKDKIRRQVYRDYYNRYHRDRMKNDINFRLRKLLRRRLKAAIKNNQKAGSAVSDLGCSIEHFKQYIESQFKPGMTWDNQGFYSWHIDHIKPLSCFDLTDRKQFLAAAHYTNQQPLWAEENLSKNDECSPVDRFFCFEPQ